MRSWLILLAVVVACLAALYLATSPKGIPPLESVARGFDAAVVARGETLAAIGNCDTCHTANSGARFAGGRGIATPFGTIYSTNVTPDPATGLGSWSKAAFQRAMHEGISRDGHYLYPAFPYDHFTQVTAEDNEALYAYLMSGPPVSAVARENKVWLPLKMRRLVAVWNGLFLKRGTQPAESAQTAEWNRGAYLVNGLGHCGACHTPRNLLGAERADRALGGGRAEGWDAYALDRTSPAPLPWTTDALATFLKAGWHAEHGNSRGPMLAVTKDLSRVPDADVHAIATYLSSNMRGRSAAQPLKIPPPSPRDGTRGANVFAAGCASCHENGEPLPFGGIDFALSSAVNAPDPRNIILVTLAGLPAADGQAAGMMPGFDGTISDDDLAALLKHLRSHFSHEPSWNNLNKSIIQARRTLQENEPP